MIKTDHQLQETQARVNMLEREVGSFIYLVAVNREIEELKEEIETYKAIKKLDFETSVETILNKGDLIENIPNILTKLRLAKGITQKELADRLGWTQSNLSRFEHENYSGQTIRKVVQYISALGIYMIVRPELPDTWESK